MYVNLNASQFRSILKLSAGASVGAQTIEPLEQTSGRLFRFKIGVFFADIKSFSGRGLLAPIGA